MKFLLTTGEAVEMGEDTVMLAGHFTRAVEIIRQYLRSHGSATASELRQALGTSRRVIIPLLERLDRDGVTVRQGDRRKLRVES
jgi:selenocysteine-specific elongation factor